MRYHDITVPSKKYEDHDDSLTAAAQDYARQHGLETWRVDARWTDGQRETITLNVPSADV